MVGPPFFVPTTGKVAATRQGARNGTVPLRGWGSEVMHGLCRHPAPVVCAGGLCGTVYNMHTNTQRRPIVWTARAHTIAAVTAWTTTVLFIGAVLALPLALAV